MIRASLLATATTTGPKSARGKAAAKMNALKHGLTAQEIVITGEDGEIFEALLETLTAHLEPVGPEEALLVERIAACMWRLRRCYAVEFGLLAYEMARVEQDAASKALEALEWRSERSSDWGDSSSPDTEEEEDEDEDEEDDQEYAEAYERLQRAKGTMDELHRGVGRSFLIDARSTNALTKLSRYEAAIERSLYRARHELERLQAARKGAAVVPPVTIDVNVDHGDIPGPKNS